jgi:hypothetical protein
MPEQPTGPASNTLEYFLALDPPDLHEIEVTDRPLVDLRFVFGGIMSRNDYDERHELHGLKQPTGTTFTFDMSDYSEEIANRFADACNLPIPNKENKKQVAEELRALRELSESDFERRVLERFAAREVGRLVLFGEFETPENRERMRQLMSRRTRTLVTNADERFVPENKGFTPIDRAVSAEHIDDRVDAIDDYAKKLARVRQDTDWAFVLGFLALDHTGQNSGHPIDELNIWITNSGVALPRLMQRAVDPRSHVAINAIGSEYKMVPLQELVLRNRFGLESTKELKLRSLLQLQLSAELHRRIGSVVRDFALKKAVYAHLLHVPEADDLEDLCIDYDSSMDVRSYIEYMYDKGIDLGVTFHVDIGKKQYLGIRKQTIQSIAEQIGRRRK